MRLFRFIDFDKSLLGSWGLLFFIILLTSCQQKREVKTSFYYWKTVYKQDSIENKYLKQFKSDKMYVRIMDVDFDLNQKAIPVAPVKFDDKLADGLEIVPVVYVVNDVLKEQSDMQIEQLSANILTYVKAKVLQSGRKDYKELQIDCDWTQTTRETYFHLLKELKKHNKTKMLSSTLRLHQLKNQEKSGVPPVDKVLLMCYNMGNLRKYGTQNSILDVVELKKYAGKNLGFYPMDIDVALPLFSWSVVFRGQQYAGISKRVSDADLKNTLMFSVLANGLYQAKIDLPQFGILQNDLVRFEQSKMKDLRETAKYLSANLSDKPLNLLFYHLDKQIFKNYTYHELEEVAHLLH